MSARGVAERKIVEAFAMSFAEALVVVPSGAAAYALGGWAGVLAFVIGWVAAAAVHAVVKYRRLLAEGSDT